MHLLDSNVWISILRGKSASSVAQLKQRPQDKIAICPVVLAELWYGACRSHPFYRAANEAMIKELEATYACLPFDNAAAIDCAELRAQLATAGCLIGPYDLLIAAIARTQKAILVTHNTAEFSRVPGLLMEDWQTD